MQCAGGSGLSLDPVADSYSVMAALIDHPPRLAESQAMAQTVDAMKSIATNISVIFDIACQTKLPALNAAAEAAWAGGHGRWRRRRQLGAQSPASALPPCRASIATHGGVQ